MKIKSIKKIDIKSKRYDIQTKKNNNFFANNILVHNSCIIVYFDDCLNKWCCGTRSRAEADGGIDDSDLTFAILVDQTCKAMWERQHPGVIRDRTPILQDLMEATQRLHPSTDAKKRTFVFELTSPINRIVCNYDEAKLTLLAVRNNLTLEEELPQIWNAKNEFGVECAKVYSFSNINHMIEVIRSWNPEHHEGVVVKDQYWNRIKVKNPSYVAFNKLNQSLQTSYRGCVEIVLLGKDDDVRSMMPQMIVDRIDTIKEVVHKLLVETRDDYKRLQHIDNMKEFALEATKCKWPAVLFALKRGKVSSIEEFYLNKTGVSSSICDMVTRLIKP